MVKKNADGIEVSFELSKAQRGETLPPETGDELTNQIEQYRSGMKTPPEIRESVVMCFRNGCTAAYVEQDDGTYKSA